MKDIFVLMAEFEEAQEALFEVQTKELKELEAKHEAELVALEAKHPEASKALNDTEITVYWAG
jgi:hypothetical protein